MTYFANTNQKKGEKSILISSNVGFRARKITRVKNDTKVNPSITRDSFKCSSKNGISKCMKQNLLELKKEFDKFTITVGDFKISWSVTDTKGRQRISKNIENVLQLDFIKVTHFCSAEDLLQRTKRQDKVRKRTVIAIP